MDCGEPPFYEILWAEGIAHAWFCKKCFRKWLEERDNKIDDVNSAKEVRDSVASKDFRKNPNPNIWEKLKQTEFKDLWDAFQKQKQEAPPAQLGEEFHFRRVTPGVLKISDDDALQKLNQALHKAYGDPKQNKEDVVNCYLLLKKESEDRKIVLKVYDDKLEDAARKLHREDIVPFVVTSQAVSLTGSSVYRPAEEPKDYDWVIRHNERIPVLEELLTSIHPGKESHFVYELKGPNWNNYPVGDFIASPTPVNPTDQDLGSYIFLGMEDGVVKLRVNSNLRDTGTVLKLERIYQDPFLEVFFSTEPIFESERPIANLYFRRNDQIILQEMKEPEFAPYYLMKPHAWNETKAEKVTGEVAVKFGQWFPPIKISAGYAPEESMDPEHHWKHFVEPMIRRDGYVLLQKKFDGERMQVHVDNKQKQVFIFTEGNIGRKQKGLERSKQMPDVTKEATKLKCDTSILDSEVTVLDEDGNPMPRHEITRLAVGKEPITGEKIIFNCFDICEYNGEPPPIDDHEKRLEMLDKVIPSDTEHFKAVETIKVHNRKEFDEAYKKLSGQIGSEGVMSKTKKMPFFDKDGKTGEMSKLKILFEVDVVIIGRRKVPAPKPAGEKVSAERMMNLLSGLLKKSNTWTFRCAFKGPDGKLWPLYSDKTYAPGDLELKWDEERAKWKGTEDPDEWEMSKEFPNSQEGSPCYGNTYNFTPSEGEPEPKLGTIVTVAPAIMRAWRKDSSVMVSWTFPKCRKLYPKADKPMDWKIINNVLSATATRHGKEAEVLIKDGMNRLDIEKAEAEGVFNDPFLDGLLAEATQAYSSPGGKKFLVPKLLPLIPDHKRYVEPFGGAAALLFAKEPSEEEVYSDLQPEYPFILRTLKSMSDADISRLRNKDWGGSKEKHKKFRMEGWRAGGDRIDRLYRILYLIKFGWGGYWTDKFGYAEKSVSPAYFDSLPKLRDRLKNVKILNRDAYQLIPELDGPDTFFYLDPPYDIDFFVKFKKAFGGQETDLKRLSKLCKNLKGKFLLSINDNERVRSAFRGFNRTTVTTRKTSAGYSTTKKEYTIPATRRRELLFSNFNFGKVKESKDDEDESHQDQREFAEKVFGDPYMIDAKGKTSEFRIQHHLRGIWTEKERQEAQKALRSAKSQEDLQKVWKQYSCELLLKPIGEWQSELKAVDDKKEDVTVVVNKHLTKDCPQIKELDLSKVIQRGNVHTDMRIKVPGKDHLIGWTITDPRLVLQFLDSGKIEMPLRDKFLAHEPDDKSPCARKAVQPQAWFHLVDSKKGEFEASPGEVGATDESGGRFYYKTGGTIAFGISKDDYHEVYLWFDKPYEALSGRWGFQELTSRREYAKVPIVWWMLDKPEKTQAPYILQNNRDTIEAKAKREGIKAMVYNPELLTILQASEQGKKWLSSGMSKSVTPRLVEEKVEEYKAGGGKWPSTDKTKER